MFSCVQQIQSEIDAKGAIPFDRFMELALYGFPNGYYRRASPVIGRSGDFITAPEISPLYNYCFARCFQQLQGQLPDAVIMEFGAGTGRLAAECLDYLAKHNTLPKQYYILELSAHLAEQQRQSIQQINPELLNIVTWLDDLPENLEGMVIANEVLDAMPVKQFRIRDSQLEECFVNYNQDGFYYQFAEPSALLKSTELPDDLFGFEEYYSECNLHIQPWLESLKQTLSKGIIYLIDYGFPAHEYYHPTRHMGTLMCHHQHTAHSDALSLVGEQDLTAHVDFTAVANGAHNAGFEVAGYTTQAHFLINCDILKMAKQPDLQQSAALKKLTLPHEMGELFKVMALCKDDFIPLGFQHGDQRHKL